MNIEYRRKNYFNKVHPDNTMGYLFQKTTDTFELLKGEVSMTLDRVGM